MREHNPDAEYARKQSERKVRAKAIRTGSMRESDPNGKYAQMKTGGEIRFG